jgi:hypothetical protein
MSWEQNARNIFKCLATPTAKCTEWGGRESAFSFLKCVELCTTLIQFQGAPDPRPLHVNHWNFEKLQYDRDQIRDVSITALSYSKVFTRRQSFYSSSSCSSSSSPSSSSSSSSFTFFRATLAGPLAPSNLPLDWQSATPFSSFSFSFAALVT